MTTKTVPRIRSIIRVTLPKFFNPEIYIWNRFSTADAILVDIRRRDDVDGGEWRREVLQSALDNAPYKPKVYVQMNSPREDRDAWMKDVALCSHKNLNGILIPVRDGNALREIESIVCQNLQESCPVYPRIEKIIPSHEKDASVLVDLHTGTVPYAVFKYHNFGSPREGAWGRLKQMVRYTNTADVMALAWRGRAINRMRDLEREMVLLKELGFTGVLLHNSDHIAMANKIFG